MGHPVYIFDRWIYIFYKDILEDYQKANKNQSNSNVNISERSCSLN